MYFYEVSLHYTRHTTTPNKQQHTTNNKPTTYLVRMHVPAPPVPQHAPCRHPSASWWTGRRRRRRLVDPLGPAGAVRTPGGAPCRRVRRQHLEAVAGHDASAPVEHAQPPAGQPVRLLLQHGEDITPVEAQLVGRLAGVVVLRLGQHQLQDRQRERVRV